MTKILECNDCKGLTINQRLVAEKKCFHCGSKNVGVYEQDEKI